MASKQNGGNENSELFSLSDDSEFSGFSSDDKLVKNKSTVKSTVTKAPPQEKGPEKSSKTKNSKSKEKSKNSKTGSKKGKNSNFDLSNMSKDDIENLKELLGLSGQLAEQNKHHPSREEYSSKDDDDNDDFFERRQCLNNLPNMRICVDPKDLSDGEIDMDIENVNPNHTKLNMNEALYDEFNDGDWDLPRAKSPAKGKPISASLAKMINVACSTQCEIDNLVSKYSLPENCDKAGAPLVNMEIWQTLNKVARIQDRSLARIQNLVASSMTPIVRLAEILKPQISSNLEAKTLLGDALTLLGQTQYSLSIRRRYTIKPNLNKKYFPLCKISQPITDKLFGDDIAKEIKACDSMTALGKYDGYSNRYRGGGKFTRKGGNRDYYRYGQQYGGYHGYYSAYDEQRYQPYPQRGGYRDRGGFRQNRRKLGNSTATSPPAPNDKQ